MCHTTSDRNLPAASHVETAAKMVTEAETAAESAQEQKETAQAGGTSGGKELENEPGNAWQYHLENVEPLENRPLEGKRILFLGSSVTKGARSLDVSMADYIGKRNNCEIVKEAVSGTTLSASYENSYVERLNNVDTSQKFDMVVCQLSTNDASAKRVVSLGEVSDSGNPEDFNTRTVAGALEYIIAYCRETWDCPVVIYTGTKYDNIKYGKMVELLPDIQEKWGIGVVDLWNNEEMNAVSEEDYELYMYDGVHPTQAGYLWWTPVIEEELYRW
ncbi:MAG: SGNH/GDSL hydrolase family protein [Lachnospiraceae bacterium]|nr:SGNH/GDSL hydrolase family protein [Lachnospiraceae bacterium]